MDNRNYVDEIKEIRSLMERSTKFISLSGLSGILAGIYALIGAWIAYRIIYSADHLIYEDLRSGTYSNDFYQLLLTAGIVAILAFFTGVILSYRKAKQQGRNAWDRTSKNMMVNFLVPLITGGIFILILFIRGYFGLLAPSALIFYGLALLAAGNFTFSDIRYLGIIEIGLGLIAGFIPSYGLYMWAIGFGVLHIVYGILMYYKYER